MNQQATAPSTPFVDRRSPRKPGENPALERRQFTNSHDDLSPGAQQLALAIDEYKLRNRRRFITYEEMYEIIRGLGYTQATKNA